MMQGVTYENTRTRQAALLLPVSEKAGLVRVNLKHGGTLIDAVYARLCPPEEQDYAEVIRTQSFADEGLTLAVSVESCPDTEGGVSVLTPCECSRLESYPAFADEIDAYDEPCRPWVHFSSVRGWINDTNGPILIDGLYHLFYQQQAGDPHATWKLCTWGHAVSKDLFHWTEVDPVIRAPGAASGCSLIRRSDGVPCIGVSHGLYESADGCMTFQRKHSIPVSEAIPRFSGTTMPGTMSGSALGASKTENTVPMNGMSPRISSTGSTPTVCTACMNARISSG